MTNRNLIPLLILLVIWSLFIILGFAAMHDRATILQMKLDAQSEKLAEYKDRIYKCQRGYDQMVRDFQQCFFDNRQRASGVSLADCKEWRDRANICEEFTQ